MSRIMNREVVPLVGQEVTIAGWVHSRRDMGKVTFFDMRDRSGLLQVVVVPSELSEASRGLAAEIRSEFCLQITGIVQQRGEKQINPKLVTGTVELLAKEIVILNPSKTPPFELEDTSGINEELRLKYRYLDLRTSRMLKNIELRDRLLVFTREFLHREGFLEVETPILTKGTPEGSREFLVPSRLHEGEFYVLPQSPQQFKQLLMVSGIEKYFQIARCFRDEDQRGDRQPEFTQIDLEMSFVDKEEEVMAILEDCVLALVAELAPEKKVTAAPIPRMTYAEAMEKYGNDKPDLRVDKNDKSELAFCWVTDFPLFEHSASEGRLVSAHHPFTAPKGEDAAMLESEPAKVRAKAYDLVLNGYEIGGGSIRIHKRDLQNQIFKVLGISDEDIALRFGHILEAFEFGAPPHGGLAVGFDRLVMILANEPNIREVIPFPKTGDARDPLMGAPSQVEVKRLNEAHIQVKK